MREKVNAPLALCMCVCLCVCGQEHGTLLVTGDKVRELGHSSASGHLPQATVQLPLCCLEQPLVYSILPASERWHFPCPQDKAPLSA